MPDHEYDVIVIGAGPAGLAAALKLSSAGKKVAVIEKDVQAGGMCRTIEFKGFRFDLGGHRFFTKSKEVEDLWQDTLGRDFLVRPRLSRIYYDNRFFNYPLKPVNALFGLGIINSINVMLSYLISRLAPCKEEKTFEQWVCNRFGKRLYKIFFKTYTEKLWGIPCDEIRSEWAAQRIKGLSLTTAVLNAFHVGKGGAVKTLMDRFRYPKHGPGMMYERLADNIINAGGEICYGSEIVGVTRRDRSIDAVSVRSGNGVESEYKAKWFVSSMPITDLVLRLRPDAPPNVSDAAARLRYRSFITVNVILDAKDIFPDNWIYIHSPEVRMGRIQNFGNWSRHMLADPTKTGLGLEYFCVEEDELWRLNDDDLIKLGLEELEKIRLADRKTFVAGFVVRVPKAYPVYDSEYPCNHGIIRDYLAKFGNILPVGRYGMFRYNNMDHSILTGIYAAENILGASHDIWEVNTDSGYLEEK